MLNENDVVVAVCSFLEGEGYAVEQRLSTNERGVDIIARQDDRVLHVEAKGGISSKQDSARFGQPFSRAQVLSHVSRALFESAKVVSSGVKGAEAAMAFPDEARHRERVQQVKGALGQLGISVLACQFPTSRKAYLCVGWRC